MNENWQTAVYKLAQMTRQGELSWERDISSAHMGLTYRAIFQDEILRIYQNFGLGLLNNARLEFIDINGNVLWSFPQHQSIDDLLVAVEFQVSSVDEKIQKILQA